MLKSCLYELRQTHPFSSVNEQRFRLFLGCGSKNFGIAARLKSARRWLSRGRMVRASPSHPKIFLLRIQSCRAKLQFSQFNFRRYLQVYLLSEFSYMRYTIHALCRWQKLPRMHLMVCSDPGSLSIQGTRLRVIRSLHLEQLQGTFSCKV